jgi:hypothetical protein
VFLIPLRSYRKVVKHRIYKKLHKNIRYVTSVNSRPVHVEQGVALDAFVLVFVLFRLVLHFADVIGKLFTHVIVPEYRWQMFRERQFSASFSPGVVYLAKCFTAREAEARRGRGEDETNV